MIEKHQIQAECRPLCSALIFNESSSFKMFNPVTVSGASGGLTVQMEQSDDGVFDRITWD